MCRCVHYRGWVIIGVIFVDYCGRPYSRQPLGWASQISVGLFDRRPCHCVRLPVNCITWSIILKKPKVICLGPHKRGNTVTGTLRETTFAREWNICCGNVFVSRFLFFPEIVCFRNKCFHVCALKKQCWLDSGVSSAALLNWACANVSVRARAFLDKWWTKVHSTAWH